MAEILSDMPEPRRVLRVGVVDPDWKIGDQGIGTVQYRVIAMDQGGSTLEIIEFDKEFSNKEKEEQKDNPMQVLPFPS
jgi:hypothetical protein